MAVALLATHAAALARSKESFLPSQLALKGSHTESISQEIKLCQESSCVVGSTIVLKQLNTLHASHPKPLPSARLSLVHASPFGTPLPSARLSPRHASPLGTPLPSARLSPRPFSPLGTPLPSAHLSSRHASLLGTPLPLRGLPTFLASRQS